MRFLLLLCLLACVGCDKSIPTTQLLVVVQLDEGLRARVDTLEFATAAETVQLPLAGVGLPLSFSVVPSDISLEGAVEVRALAAGAEVARRELRFAFRKYRSMSYGIVLSEGDCNGGACGEGETCGDCDTCTALTVEDEELEPLARASDAVSRWQSRLTCEP